MLLEERAFLQGVGVTLEENMAEFATIVLLQGMNHTAIVIGMGRTQLVRLGVLFAILPFAIYAIM